MSLKQNINIIDSTKDALIARGCPPVLAEAKALLFIETNDPVYLEYKDNGLTAEQELQLETW